MSLSSDIKEYALSLGYDRVGFTTAEPFPIHRQELTKRRQGYEWAIESRIQLLRASDPRAIWPEAKSIVIAVTDYFKESFPRNMVGKIGRMYLSYGGAPPHPVHRARLRLLREFLEKRGVRMSRDPAVPPARLAAARAGVTYFGKNCFAFAEGIGSWVIISTLVVDSELEYGEPMLEVKCPEKCTLCIDSCPTGALYEPLRMNPLLCLAYNSYATPGSPLGSGLEVLPMTIREVMGSWIYGCDVCQQVCPHNQTRLKAKLPPNTYLEHVSDDFHLDRLLNMSDEHFNTRVSTLLHYIKDKRYIQRNAAVALGNLGESSAVRALDGAMRDTDELVRGHAAWALGKIGNERAKRILKTSLNIESSDYARGEIMAALEE